MYSIKFPVTLTFNKLPEGGSFQDIVQDMLEKSLLLNFKCTELADVEVGPALDVGYGDNPKTDVQELAQQMMDITPPNPNAIKEVQAELVSKEDLEKAPTPDLDHPPHGIETTMEDMANMPGALKARSVKHET